MRNRVPRVVCRTTVRELVREAVFKVLREAAFRLGFERVRDFEWE
jgi:hypothetical protein